MKRILPGLILAALCGPAAMQAEQKKRPPRAATERPAVRNKPEAKPTRVFEFEDKEVAEILRTLAREVPLDLVVSSRITNERATVTLRVENKSPREVIQIIAKANNLEVDELDGVSYVKHRSDLSVWDLAGREWLLEYEVRPDAARKVAKAKRALFDALLAAKFTREEALQLVMADEEPNVPTTAVIERKK